MKEKYIEDIKEIRDIMNRSYRFISLSGFSGITAGIIGLVGAFAAYYYIFNDQNYLSFEKVFLPEGQVTKLLAITLITLFLGVSGGIYFTTKETRRQRLKVWDLQTKRLLTNLLIPLLTGGIVCVIFLSKGYIGLLIPMTLVFYGLALINASKFTVIEIRNLGILEIILGLAAMQYIHLGMWFWAVGFGILHIVYGTMMYWKQKQ